MEVRIEDRWIFSRLNTCGELASPRYRTMPLPRGRAGVVALLLARVLRLVPGTQEGHFQENSGLTAGWRNTLAAFETALRLLHPAMPFSHRRAVAAFGHPIGARGPPRSRWPLNPRYNPDITDFKAEREIGILQEIVTMARTLRTESKLDPKQQLEGVLHSRGPALEVAERHAVAIQKLANVVLEFHADAAPEALPVSCAPPLNSTWCFTCPSLRKTRSANVSPRSASNSPRISPTRNAS